jgi:hypothetical protein
MTPFDAAQTIGRAATSFERLSNSVQTALRWLDELAAEVAQVREQVREQAAARLK